MQKKTTEKEVKDRHLLLILVSLGIFLVFTLRLSYLQLFSPEYKKKAAINAMYKRPLYPDRGAIFDRNGKLLVYNEPSYDLLVTRNDLKYFDTTALCKLINIDTAFFNEQFIKATSRETNRGYNPYTPQVLIQQIGVVEAGRLQEQMYRFPGFSLQKRSVRCYAQPVAGVLLGYMSECNQKEIEADSLLAPGDYIGKSGVERTYESILRGNKGYQVMLRDAVGRIQGSYNRGAMDRSATSGKNIFLSIDSELQAFGEKLMLGKKGAIVAIEPQTGEILALVSSPSFDPSLLSGKNLGKNFMNLQGNPQKPLFNRAIMGTYPPGSTFKPGQAGMLLQRGIINPHTLYTCYNGYPLMRGKPACHSHYSPLNVTYAIATSCNAFFCWGLHYLIDGHQGFDSKQDAMDAWRDDMVKLGFGYTLNVDLPGEKRGYIPNSSVYDKVYKRRWNSSTIISIAIGQGEVTATPLQIANLASIIANRGYYYPPHVVKEIQGDTLDSLYIHKRSSDISSNNWEVVVEGMARAVTSGTCHQANFAPGEIEVCGKTGTAENPHGKDHSAFMGFAPRYNPQIAIAVYVENGGFGAFFGVPIGRLMMEYYLHRGVLSEYSKSLAESMTSKRIPYSNGY